MNLNEFNQHCQRAGYPLVSENQWALLMRSTYGQAIQAQSSDQGEFHPTLECILRAISPAAQRALEEGGLVYCVQDLLDIASQEGRQLFVALHRASTDATALQYIHSLPLTKRPKLLVAAPYFSFHVYGAKGALCFSEAQTRSNQRHTINIEGANVLGHGSHYDWVHKIIVQLSPEEMFLVLAVLNGKLDSLQFTGHGTNHDKVLEMTLQHSHYFIKLVQRDRSPVAVPMEAQHALELMSLLFGQIKKNHPHLGKDELQMMEDQLVRMHKNKILNRVA